MSTQHIFLLSHMRAYTSLFGHIMGSNPEICGYYEMHIGYYSRKSLLRQKLLYFKEEERKPQLKYMFDKVLHNEHEVSPVILSSNVAKTIFCLRGPQDVIPSITKLYQKIDPTHELSSVEYATTYYIQRLLKLEEIAQKLNGGFCYLDADTLKTSTQTTLGLLSEWLGLTYPLSAEYSLQKKTSKERYGDTSALLTSGRIVGTDSVNSDFPVHDGQGEEAKDCYMSVRSLLIRLSSCQSIVSDIE